jgi:hypothetical protein
MLTLTWRWFILALKPSIKSSWLTCTCNANIDLTPTLWWTTQPRFIRASVSDVKVPQRGPNFPHHKTRGTWFAVSISNRSLPCVVMTKALHLFWIHHYIETNNVIALCACRLTSNNLWTTLYKRPSGMSGTLPINPLLHKSKTSSLHYLVHCTVLWHPVHNYEWKG